MTGFELFVSCGKRRGGKMALERPKKRKKLDVSFCTGNEWGRIGNVQSLTISLE
jgi:hypothetical protein